MTTTPNRRPDCISGGLFPSDYVIRWPDGRLTWIAWRLWAPGSKSMVKNVTDTITAQEIGQLMGGN